MANQQPRTTFLNDWAASYNVICSCERGNVQLYICNVETCEDHEQQYFCADCVVEDQKHNHKRTSIKQELETRMQSWQELTENAKQLKQIIDTNYPDHKPLLKYLDNESLLQEPGLNVLFPTHYISQDVEIFLAEFTKITQMMAEMETLFETKDITKILKRIPELIQFQISYEKLKYLKSFKDADKHESFFYEVYEPVMKIVATSCRPFTDFKQVNNDSLFRLKWRWLAQRVNFNNQGPVEEVKGQAEPLNNNPQHGPQELSNLINLVKQLQDKISHFSAINENKDFALLIEANDKIKHHESLIQNQEQSLKKIQEYNIKNQEQNQIIGENINSIQNEFRRLIERISAQEKQISPLDSRLSTLEKINTACDFPNSVTGLISLNLEIKFQECVKRLNNIEKMENEFNQTALMKLMLKLENDNQQLKNEIKDLQTKISEEKKKDQEVKEQKKEEVKQSKSEEEKIQPQEQIKLAPNTADTLQNLSQFSQIINRDQANKIMTYFPESKRNFKVENIYNGSRDGWEIAVYREKVFNKGPTLIILKTTQGAICGGYTSKNWENNNEWINDDYTFVFNTVQRFNCNNSSKAIRNQPRGFCFGSCILYLTSDTTLNQHNKGICYTGKQMGYDIEGDVSPLTNQKGNFTCAQLEVYKVNYN